MKVKKKHLEGVVSNLKKRFVFFGRSSGLHGFNQLFKENVKLLARLFWLVVLVASTVCLYLLIVPVLEADGKIYFAPDTRYLEWTTSFPAVTICEQTNTKFAARKLAELYPDLLKPLSYSHQRYITDLLYGRGSCSRDLCLPCGHLVPCNVSWRDVMENVHKNCEELVSNCAYNGVEFSCCETFLPADSERGPCYTFNARQNVEFIKELFTVNMTTGPGAVTFQVLADVDVSIHSNEELATNSLSDKLKFPIHITNENNFEILFSVVEIENEPAVFEEDINERQCRFHDEIPDDMFHTYSVYSHCACTLALNTEHVFEHCGCISPLRDVSCTITRCASIKLEYMSEGIKKSRRSNWPNSVFDQLSQNNNNDQKIYCNYTGMVCVTEHEVLKNKLGIETGEEEEKCLPSCVESELYIKYHSRTFVPEHTGNTVRVKIEMAGLPTLRYERKLLRTNLDFVVSVGGMAGLFFGASVLSIIEIFYLIMRKSNKT